MAAILKICVANNFFSKELSLKSIYANFSACITICTIGLIYVLYLLHYLGMISYQGPACVCDGRAQVTVK